MFHAASEGQIHISFPAAATCPQLTSEGTTTLPAKAYGASVKKAVMLGAAKKKAILSARKMFVNVIRPISLARISEMSLLKGTCQPYILMTRIPLRTWQRRFKSKIHVTPLRYCGREVGLYFGRRFSHLAHNADAYIRALGGLGAEAGEYLRAVQVQGHEQQEKARPNE